jgi:hypothetical protein
MSDSGNPDPITDLILLKFFSSAREDEKLLFLIYYNNKFGAKYFNPV